MSDMSLIEQILFAVAIVAFVGVGIYTVASSYYIVSSFNAINPPRDRSLIPIRLRRFGYWSMGVFVGCVVLLVLASEIRLAG